MNDNPSRSESADSDPVRDPGGFTRRRAIRIAGLTAAGAVALATGSETLSHASEPTAEPRTQRSTNPPECVADLFEGN